jgi:hypothetical protein
MIEHISIPVGAGWFNPARRRTPMPERCVQFHRVMRLVAAMCLVFEP